MSYVDESIFFHGQTDRQTDRQHGLKRERKYARASLSGCRGELNINYHSVVGANPLK